MQGLVHHLDPSSPIPHNNNDTDSGGGGGRGSTLSIDVSESAETRIRRLIDENPVIIFSRSSCCMCHVMKKLLSAVGVHPTVIELEEQEITALPLPSAAPPPAVFIGGACVGGLESLVGLHLTGHLVPKLVQVGALWGMKQMGMGEY